MARRQSRATPAGNNFISDEDENKQTERDIEITFPKTRANDKKLFGCCCCSHMMMMMMTMLVMMIMMMIMMLRVMMMMMIMKEQKNKK